MNRTRNSFGITDADDAKNINKTVKSSPLINDTMRERLRTSTIITRLSHRAFVPMSENDY